MKKHLEVLHLNVKNLSFPDRVQKQPSQSAKSLSLSDELPKMLTHTPILHFNGKNITLPDKMQQHPNQLVKSLRLFDEFSKPLTFLSFSVGFDSVFWYNQVVQERNGRAAFIEDDVNWLQKVQSIYSYLSIFKANYTTNIFEDFDRVVKHSALWCTLLPMDLPPIIRSTSWNVIMVDGPMGYNADIHPGRFQSLFEAARLVSLPNGYIVVDDCERAVEGTVADLLFGAENRISRIERPKREHAKINSQCIYKATTDMPALKANCSLK